MDYAWTLTHRSVLQEAADVAALAGAKELALSDAKRDNVQAVVQAMAARYIEGNTKSLAKKNAVAPTVLATVIDEPLSVEVKIQQHVDPLVGGNLGLEFGDIDVRSVARVIGQPNICILALSYYGGTGLLLENDALVTGRNCSAFSNSTSKSSIRGRNNSRLTANFICSAGGADGVSNFSPPPMTDCPQFQDPLEDRSAPSIGACTETNFVHKSGSRSLRPGTYCGGLTVEGGDVRLEPGEYIIKDGPLNIDGSGRLEGVGVGFYLTGSRATVTFNRNSSISLEAPENGPMAGLLFFEDRSQPIGNAHIIYSNDARNLLGTIYIPRGILLVDANSPVADQSAYTAIVADTIKLKGGPHLILNTDYDKTDVPVPKGIRGAGQPVALAE